MVQTYCPDVTRVATGGVRASWLVAEVNAAGGVLGRPLELDDLEHLDDAGAGSLGAVGFGREGGDGREVAVGAFEPGGAIGPRRGVGSRDAGGREIGCGSAINHSLTR